MLMTQLVLALVAAALLIGAGWGLFAPLPERLEGFVIALAGGALIVSIMSELVERAAPHLPFMLLALSLLGGAAAFVLLDRQVKRRMGAQSGGGVVAASLATEVFPKAYKEDSHATGFAIALGLVAAQGLGQLGG